MSMLIKGGLYVHKQHKGESSGHWTPQHIQLMSMEKSNGTHRPQPKHWIHTSILTHVYNGHKSAKSSTRGMLISHLMHSCLLEVTHVQVTSYVFSFCIHLSSESWNVFALGRTAGVCIEQSHQDG